MARKKLKAGTKLSSTKTFLTGRPFDKPVGPPV